MSETDSRRHGGGHPASSLPRALGFAFNAIMYLCGNAAAAGLPGSDCYEHIYDATHLAAHPGQFVVRVTALVKQMDAAEAAVLGPTYERDVELRIWVKGQKDSFDSFGACKPANGGLICQGSLSAAEADPCKIDRDGIQNNCRISAATDGAFAVLAQSDTLVVKILRRLELVPKPYDVGPFLYLSPENAENHTFALRPVPVSACK